MAITVPMRSTAKIGSAARNGQSSSAIPTEATSTTTEKQAKAPIRASRGGAQASRMRRGPVIADRADPQPALTRWNSRDRLIGLSSTGWAGAFPGRAPRNPATARPRSAGRRAVPAGQRRAAARRSRSGPAPPRPAGRCRRRPPADRPAPARRASSPAAVTARRRPAQRLGRPRPGPGRAACRTPAGSPRACRSSPRLELGEDPAAVVVRDDDGQVRHAARRRRRAGR